MARRRSRIGPVALAFLLGFAVALVPLPVGRAASVEPLPVATGPKFLTGLTVDPTEPGASVPLTFSLSNPLDHPVTGGELTFGLYAFNPSPGTGSEAVPDGAAELSAPAVAGGAAQQGINISLAVPTLAAGATNWSVPVTFLASASAPQGTYAIRDRLTFTSDGGAFELASIGNFPRDVWENATVLPNGTPTVNLTRLGVSGILPETAVLVRSTTSLDLALYLVLGAAGALLLAGAYVGLRRRRPGSTSGRSSAPEESQAPSAFGKRRTKDGD